MRLLVPDVAHDDNDHTPDVRLEVFLRLHGVPFMKIASGQESFRPAFLLVFDPHGDVMRLIRRQGPKAFAEHDRDYLWEYLDEYGDRYVIDNPA